MRVATPVKGFTGTVAGVEFVDGRGETDNVAALAYFKRQGYDIQPDKPKPAAKKTAKPKQSE